MKMIMLLVAVVAIVFLWTTPAVAQLTAPGTTGAAAPAPAANWGTSFGAGMGAGLTILGAGYGISAIAGRAVESMARQPEVSANINGAMIISAALIEGVSFFSLIVCILILALE